MFTPCTGTGFASIIEDRAKNSMQGLARQSAAHTTDGASQDLPSHGIFILSSTEAQPAAHLPDATHGLESGLSPLNERTAPDDSPFLSPSSSSALRLNDDDGGFAAYVSEPSVFLAHKNKRRKFDHTAEMEKEAFRTSLGSKKSDLRRKYEYECGAVAEGTDSHPSQHSITENSFLASQTLALPSSNSSRHEAEDEAALIYSGIDNQPVGNADLRWKFYHAVCVDHALSDYSSSDIVHELLHWSVFHSTLQLTNTEDSPSTQYLDAVSVFHSAMSFLSDSDRLELASAITHAHSTSI
jgi:hypothetical protein